MGGSLNPAWFGMAEGAGMQPPQYQSQQFNGDQVLDYAKNNFNYENAQAYKQAVANELRASNKIDPNAIWATIMNNKKQAEFNAAQQQAMPFASEVSDTPQTMQSG